MRKHPVLAIVAFLALLLGGAPLLAACGSSSSDDRPDPTCFTQMTSDQKTQLSNYISQQGGQVTGTTNNANGTQDVCVLEPDGHGGYDAHHYRQQDNFGDYMLLAMLTGNANSIATYGLISGDLDFGQYLTLQLLTGMQRSGSMYHPYTYDDGSHNWNRRSTTIKNVHVTVIQYGHAKPRSYKSAYKAKPPAGYASYKLPRSNGQEADFTKGSNGRSTITSTNKIGSGNSYRNPGRSNAPSPRTTGGASPRSTTRTTTGTNNTTARTATNQAPAPTPKKPVKIPTRRR